MGKCVIYIRKCIYIKSRTFYQCVVVIGLIVVTINMIWEIGTGSFNYRNAVIDVWALITCITYIVGRNNRHKYVIMWAVLFSQLMLALWTIDKIIYWKAL